MSLARNIRRAVAARRFTLDVEPNLPMERVHEAIAELRADEDECLAAVFKAVRDHGCALAVITPGAHPFRLPDGAPIVAIICDDADRGWENLPEKSIRRFARRCDAAAIVDTHARRPLYAAAAIRAVDRRHHVLVVETKPCRRGDWLALIRSAHPAIDILQPASTKGLH